MESPVFIILTPLLLARDLWIEECHGLVYIITLNIYKDSKTGIVHFRGIGMWLVVGRCQNSGVFIGRNEKYSIRSYVNLPCGLMGLANNYFLGNIVILSLGKVDKNISNCKIFRNKQNNNSKSGIARLTNLKHAW